MQAFRVSHQSPFGLSQIPILPKSSSSLWEQKSPIPRRNQTSHSPEKKFNPFTMAKKRKSIATSLDEVDRTMYASFCSAANSLSQLYTQAMNHQKLSFQAGERHAMVWNFICPPFSLFPFPLSPYGFYILSRFYVPLLCAWNWFC